MSTLRMTSDLRRQLILGRGEALLCTTRVCGDHHQERCRGRGHLRGAAVQAFPVQGGALRGKSSPMSARPIRSWRICSARNLPPPRWSASSPAWFGHFLQISSGAEEEEAQRLRLMASSHLGDGEFARILYAKVGDLIGPAFTASLDHAVAAGEASRIAGEPLNLFWFAHHTVLMAALARLPSVPCLTYGEATQSRTAALRIYSSRHRPP